MHSLNLKMVFSSMRLLLAIVIVLFATVVSPQLLFAGQEPRTENSTISQKAIVFFTLSKRDYAALSEEKREVVDEVLSDFYLYAGNLEDYTTKKGIKSVFTTADKIEIRLDNGRRISYSRRKLGVEVGIILTDGKQKPRLIQGVETDTDLLPIINKFFSIKGKP